MAGDGSAMVADARLTVLAGEFSGPDANGVLEWVADHAAKQVVVFDPGGILDPAAFPGELTTISPSTTDLTDVFVDVQVGARDLYVDLSDVLPLERGSLSHELLVAIENAISVGMDNTYLVVASADTVRQDIPQLSRAIREFGASAMFLTDNPVALFAPPLGDDLAESAFDVVAFVNPAPVNDHVQRLLDLSREDVARIRRLPGTTSAATLFDVAIVRSLADSSPVDVE